jgi:hypothetical protein
MNLVERWLAELTNRMVAVPAVGLGDDRAAGQVERREQAGRAVADVVVGHPGKDEGDKLWARHQPSLQTAKPSKLQDTSPLYRVLGNAVCVLAGIRPSSAGPLGRRRPGAP